MASMAEAWSVVSSTGCPTRALSASTSDSRMAVSDAAGTSIRGARSRPRARRRLEGIDDTDQAILSAEVGRQVLGVGPPGPVERLPLRHPQARGGQPGRQPVDRHDPTGVQHLAITIDRLEVGVVDGHPPATPLEAPGHDDLLARPQPPFDEPATEPHGVDLATPIPEARRSHLHPSPEGCLHLDAIHPDPGRHDRALLRPHEIAELRQLAQVVVATREMEQQVAHVVPAEPQPGPVEHARRGQTGVAQRRREQRDRIGGRRDLRRPRRARAPRHRGRYSAEIR
jgi:hypothetical protein